MKLSTNELLQRLETYIKTDLAAPHQYALGLLAEAAMAIRHGNIENPSSFWHAKTPAEIEALLGAAPKFAAPWKERDACDCGCGQERPANSWIRKSVYAGGSMVGSVRPSYIDETEAPEIQGSAWTTAYVSSGFFGTVGEAKAFVDSELKKDGWRLG